MLWLWSTAGFLFPAYGLSYLEVEHLAKAGMSEALLKAQIQKNNDFFAFDEIIYLQERQLPVGFIEFLLRYHLSVMPDIDVELLVEMKSFPLRDEIIEMLVDRFGVVSLPLQPEEILALQEAKVSAPLIEYLIFASR